MSSKRKCDKKRSKVFRAKKHRSERLFGTPFQREAVRRRIIYKTTATGEIPKSPESGTNSDCPVVLVVNPEEIVREGFPWKMAQYGGFLVILAGLDLPQLEFATADLRRAPGAGGNNPEDKTQPSNKDLN